ncbi:MAG: DUF2252 family protein [Myxococcales bacterium]|nr:DUF2252 family protein [Myxococcales bacterium]
MARIVADPCIERATDEKTRRNRMAALEGVVSVTGVRQVAPCRVPSLRRRATSRYERLVVRAAQIVPVCVAIAACVSPFDDARTREIVSVLSQADEPLIRTRPALAASKYEAMSSSLFAFFRGTFPLYLHDTQTHVGGLVASDYFAEAYPMSLGDAHPENFGTLVARDGTMALEPNDLDAADRYPYLWEVRRLGVGLCIAARVSNPSDEAARALTRSREREYAFALADAYAAEVRRLDEGGERGRYVDPTGSAFLEDLFERALDDLPTRSELGELTVVEGGARKLKRGGIDPDDPTNVFTDLADVARVALPATLEGYRATLVSPPPASFFRIKDAAREYGSGVASRPRVRVIILVEGQTEDPADDVILELKEIGDTGMRPVGRPTVAADDTQGRIRYAQRTAWTRRDADPLWGMSELLGLPVQIKGELEAHKTIRVARIEEEIGTPEAMLELASHLGGVLARAHAGSEEDFPGTLAAIAGAVGQPGFADEQAEVSIAYADQVEADFGRFRAAFEELGPRLGIPEDAADKPDADIAALLGAPPEGGEQ